MSNKFFAKKETIDGIIFDSQKEARRYVELKLLERSGIINDLILQPRYNMEINDIRIGFYKADFKYFDNEQGKEIVEDVKGYKKGAAYQLFRIKKKIVQAIFNIEIIEI